MINKITMSGSVSASLENNKLTFKESTIVEVKDKELILYTEGNCSNNISIIGGSSGIIINGSSIIVNGKDISDLVNEASKKEKTEDDKGVMEFDLSDYELKIKKINMSGQSILNFSDDVSLNRLRKVSLSGQSNITLEQQSIDDLTIGCSGQSRVSMYDITLDELDISCSGQSYVSGRKVTYKEIDKHMSGQSRIDIN
jgi:hypothetical protein